MVEFKFSLSTAVGTVVGQLSSGLVAESFPLRGAGSAVSVCPGHALLLLLCLVQVVSLRPRPLEWLSDEFLGLLIFLVWVATRLVKTTNTPVVFRGFLALAQA